MAAGAVFESGDVIGNGCEPREIGDVPAVGDVFAGAGDGVRLAGGGEVFGGGNLRFLTTRRRGIDLRFVGSAVCGGGRVIGDRVFSVQCSVGIGFLISCFRFRFPKSEQQE